MSKSKKFKTPKYKRGITLKDNGNTDASVVRRSAFAIADRLPDFSFRNPVAEDAQAIHDLIAACPPLDTNSLYCNLLQCTQFAERSEERRVGKEWVSTCRSRWAPYQ